MSQSPVADFDPRIVERYQQGWKALNRLLHEERSFSGHERNCAYLNTGGKDFADVSFVSGLDFLDDGRGIGLVDWDFDGDLDFWTTNRTAPRIRFMKNMSPPGSAFVTVRLEGDGKRTNRDAIGARMRLYLKGEKVPRLRTLKAGDGFLSMSSKWVHFGLGSTPDIERLEIDWPGGTTEKIVGLEPGGFFVVEQGSGKGIRYLRPAVRGLEPSQPELPEESDAARIVLAARLPCPVLPVKDGDGKERVLDGELRGPVLVNLWASWCAPCVQEMAEWTRQAGKFTGLRILALNTDGLDPVMGDPAGAAAMLEKLAFPFETFEARRQAVRNLDLLQRATLDRWLTLPVPATFLLDDRGDVAVIYRGPVTTEQLLADVAMLGKDRSDLRPLATPFAGVWTHDPPAPQPVRLAVQFIDFAQADEALEYLKRYIDGGGGFHLPETERKFHHADILYVLAVLLMEDKQLDAAKTALEEAAALNPNDARVRFDLGRAMGSGGDLAGAERQFREVLRLNPNHLAAVRMLAVALARQERFSEAALLYARLVRSQPKDAKLRRQYGVVLEGAGDAASAVEEYKAVLELEPEILAVANSIARIWAAHPDAKLRKGREALVLGKRLFQRSRSAASLDTLGMAYAELGQFDKALESARAAAKLRPGDAGIAERIALYEEGRAFRMAVREGK